MVRLSKSREAQVSVGSTPTLSVPYFLRPVLQDALPCVALLPASLLCDRQSGGGGQDKRPGDYITGALCILWGQSAGSPPQFRE